MRIISGSARGTNLRAPAGMNTRPTADRIKESLFNILRADVYEAAVLDLFCGSGALGLEALSRGARDAAFVDRDRNGISCTKANAAHTHLLERCSFYQLDFIAAIERLKREKKCFDLVFCDPPYRHDLCQKALLPLLAVMAPGALLVAEMGKEEELSLTGLPYLLQREKTYGATTKIVILQCPLRREGCDEDDESHLSGQF